jgi:hypothetical protein
MPIATGSVVLAANVDSGNQMAGNIEEFVTRPSWIRLAGVTSLAPLGTAATVTTFKLFVGRTIVGNSQQMPSVGTSISLKDNIIVEHLGVRGRIFLSFVSGGAPVVIWRLDIVPMVG